MALSVDLYDVSHKLNLGVVFWKEDRKVDATSSGHIQSVSRTPPLDHLLR